MVKLHHVYHTGANNLYFQRVLQCLKDSKRIDLTIQRIDDFVECGLLDADVLCYQTYPDENVKAKFNPNLIEKSDRLFRLFSGHKIIVDSHDCGEIDSYERFEDSKDLPRVKCFPTRWFLDNYNVILISSFSTRDTAVYNTYGSRNIRVSCKLRRKNGHTGYYFHKIRECVLDSLETFFPDDIYYDWADGRDAYCQEMRRTLIAIGAPGWGQYNATYQLALRCGALLFAHCSFKDIVYLPHTELIDEEDFISYNMFDFHIKLKRLLDMPLKEINRIRRNGRIKYSHGYDVNKSAEQFLMYLNNL